MNELDFEKILEENNRFVMKPTDITFTAKDEISSVEGILNEKQEVGTIVQLKGTNQFVEIEQIDFEMSGTKLSDYVGRVLDNNKRVLFNQKDILVIVEKKNSQPMTR